MVVCPLDLKFFPQITNKKWLVFANFLVLPNFFLHGYIRIFVTFCNSAPDVDDDDDDVLLTPSLGGAITITLRDNRDFAKHIARMMVVMMRRKWDHYIWKGYINFIYQRWWFDACLSIC